MGLLLLLYFLPQGAWHPLQASCTNDLPHYKNILDVFEVYIQRLNVLYFTTHISDCNT